MDNITISIFGNKILSEIINELKIFSKFKIKFYNNLYIQENLLKDNHVIIYFLTGANQQVYNDLLKKNLPIIKITHHKNNINNFTLEATVETINIPFKVLDLEKKIISVISKHKFKNNSLINLSGYIINKNERNIKKQDKDLQLTEMEINFLTLFSKSKKPLSRNYILENVWNYSSESETHTIETHIHRLRKKISDRFQDNNFIKNNKDGYYI